MTPLDLLDLIRMVRLILGFLVLIQIIFLNRISMICTNFCFLICLTKLFRIIACANLFIPYILLQKRNVFWSY